MGHQGKPAENEKATLELWYGYVHPVRLRPANLGQVVNGDVGRPQILLELVAEARKTIKSNSEINFFILYLLIPFFPLSAFR
jgi:hypothetical protein